MNILFLLLFGIFICQATYNVYGEQLNNNSDGAIDAHSAATKSPEKENAIDNREKRNLMDLGNAGYLYTNGPRRVGYGTDPNYSFASQISPSGPGGYANYPQYLEAPEPIIEIIIKESNETLPTSPPAPIVTKKKKEKVHVFYVNYKKDENNKLHLESPIASLNNDDAEEEEEEIVYHPPTAAPTVARATTLRTIIHPDSEKYHSNSNIRVTFGSENKSQRDNIYEEHNAESIQRQVVALPTDNANIKRDSFVGSVPAHHQSFRFPAQQGFASPNSYQNTQQLPFQRFSNYFRLPTQPEPKFQQTHQKQLQHSYSQRHEPTRELPQAQALHQKPSYQQSHQQPLQQYSQGLRSQQGTPNIQQKPIPNYTPIDSKKKEPLYPPQISYEPVKFRPTLPPAPMKSEQANFPSYTQQQKQPQTSSSFYFNRQPQFVQKPSFIIPSPTHLPNQSYRLPSNPTQQSQQLNKAQNYFGQTFNRDTELLKSIPKFEQHITETIHNQPSQTSAQQQRQQSQQNYVNSNTRNQAIHNIPAPDLSPNSQHANQAQATNENFKNTVSNTPQNFVTPIPNNAHTNYYTSTASPYLDTSNSQHVMVVTPVPAASHQYMYNQGDNQQTQGHGNSLQRNPISNQPFSVSTYHSDVFKQLEQKSMQYQQDSARTNTPTSGLYASSSNPAQEASTSRPEPVATVKNSASLLELPAEVPDDLRQHLLSSGILNNADISVLDYDKVGDIALENLPAEHLQHFYGAGGGQQVAESKKIATIVKQNGDEVFFSKKDITPDQVHKKGAGVKVVRFDGYNGNEGNSTFVINPEEQTYNRYLPLKLDGQHFPLGENEALRGKKIDTVVLLAPVTMGAGASEQGYQQSDVDETKFLSDAIKTVLKKPTRDNFKHWLEKESKLDVEAQAVVLLVTRSTHDGTQDIYMYDILTGSVNKLKGELSSTFVNLAEENSTPEQSTLKSMIESKLTVPKNQR